MPECQCAYVVVQNPSLVIGTSHECLGLFHHAHIESLVVDAFEAAFDHCIFLLLCLKNTLVQIDVLHAHSLTIDHHIARNSLRCIVYHMLLINQAIHLRSQSNELRDTMSVVLVLKDRSRQLLVEVPMKGTCSCSLHARSTSRVVHRNSSCYRVQRSQTTCTYRTSCERCCPCHSVVR